jgi:hypothetical protein
LESKAPDRTLAPAVAEVEARKAAAEYAAVNTSFATILKLDEADIQIGYLADPLSPGEELDTSIPERFNAVRVRVRRDAGSNGAIPMFFARLFGKDTADTEATATAVFIDNVAGFRPPLDGENLPILPFALDAETWSSALNGQGPDEWKWDANNKKFVPGSDGIPEFNLYPQDTGSAANRGTVNIGATANSTSHVADQILHGVSSADLDFHGGELRFDDNLQLFLDGDPGISAGFKDELFNIRGEARIAPVFTEMNGNGNGVYTIVEWAGIRIADVDLTGQAKRVIAQAAKVSTDGTLPGHGSNATSNFVFSRVWINR